LTRACPTSKDDRVTDDIQATLTALADPGRRRAVELLADRPLRTAALAELAGASRPAAGRHLRELTERGLVEAAVDRQGTVYRLRTDRFFALQHWLTDLWVYWRQQLDAPIDRPGP
jgi:DNA-binding transcriptional ArsR family regulator